MAKVAGTFVPTDANVPIVDAKYIKGGLQVAANEAARLALPVALLSVGTHVFQDDTNATWRVSAINGETVTWEDATPAAGASLTDIRDRMPRHFTCIQTVATKSAGLVAVSIGAQISGQSVPTVWSAGQRRYVIVGSDMGTVLLLDGGGNWTVEFDAATSGDFNNLYSIATGSQASIRNIVKKNGSSTLMAWTLTAANVFGTAADSSSVSLATLIGTMSGLLVPAASQTSVVSAINAAFFPFLGTGLTVVDFINSNNSGFFSAQCTLGDPVPGSCGLTYTVGMKALNGGFGGAGLGVYTLGSDGFWTATNPMTDNGYRVVLCPAARITGEFHAYTGTVIYRKSGSTKEAVFSVRANAVKVTSAANGYVATDSAGGDPFDLTTAAKTWAGAINEVNAKVATAAAATEVFSVVQTANEGVCQTTVTLGTQVADAGTGVLWASGNLRAVGSGANRGAIYQIQANGTSTLLYAHNVSSTGASTFNRWTVGQYNRVDLMQVVAGTVTPNTMMYQNSLRIWRALGASGAQTVEAALVALEGADTTLTNNLATANARIDNAYQGENLNVVQVGDTDVVSANVTLGAQVPGLTNGQTWNQGYLRFANSGAQAGAVYTVGPSGVVSQLRAPLVDSVGATTFQRFITCTGTGASYTILVKDGVSSVFQQVGTNDADGLKIIDTGDTFNTSLGTKVRGMGKLANLVQSVKTTLVDALNELFGLTKKIPIDTFNTDYSFVITDGGRMKMHPSADTTARVLTIPANASVAFDVGTVLTVHNQNAAGAVTIAITTDTMRLAGPGTTGSRVLAANGMATFTKTTTTEWVATGVGLT